MIMALFCLILGSYMDFLTTFLAIRYFGAFELNPFVRRMIYRPGGWVEWMIIKTLISLLAISSFVIANQIRFFDLSQLSETEMRIYYFTSKLWHIALWLGGLGMLAMSLYNVFVILAKIL